MLTDTIYRPQCVLLHQNRARSVACEKRGVACKKRIVACMKRSVACKKRSVACKKRSVACKKRIVTGEKRNVACKKRSVACKKRSVPCKKRSVACKKRASVWEACKKRVRHKLIFKHVWCLITRHVSDWRYSTVQLCHIIYYRASFSLYIEFKYRNHFIAFQPIFN